MPAARSPAKDNRAAAAEAPGTLAADTNTAAPKAVADAVQPPALTAPSQNTPAQAATAPPPPLRLAPQQPPFRCTASRSKSPARRLAGKNHFEIRLDPPELGRIEVRLDVDRDGNVTSRMIADRSDTLDLLRRDASGLERALQDAGLKTADNSLQFSLRDHSSHSNKTTAAPIPRGWWWKTKRCRRSTQRNAVIAALPDKAAASTYHVPKSGNVGQAKIMRKHHEHHRPPSAPPLPTRRQAPRPWHG